MARSRRERRRREAGPHARFAWSHHDSRAGSDRPNHTRSPRARRGSSTRYGHEEQPSGAGPSDERQPVDAHAQSPGRAQARCRHRRRRRGRTVARRVRRAERNRGASVAPSAGGSAAPSAPDGTGPVRVRSRSWSEGSDPSTEPALKKVYDDFKAQNPGDRVGHPARSRASARSWIGSRAPRWSPASRWGS